MTTVGVKELILPIILLVSTVFRHVVRRWTLVKNLHCVAKNAPTLKRYSSKLYGLIWMTFSTNFQKTLE